MYDALLSKLHEMAAELFEPFRSIIEEYGVDGFMLGIITIAVFIAEFVLYSKGIIFSWGEKRVKEAERDGRTLEATRISCRKSYYTYKTGSTDCRWYARYEYTMGGKRRIKKVDSEYLRYLPSTITLYYKESGKKAYTYGEFSDEPFFFLVFVVPFMVSGVIGWLIGYLPLI